MLNTLVVFSVRVFFRRNCCFDRNADLSLRIGDVSAHDDTVANALVGVTTEAVSEALSYEVIKTWESIIFIRTYCMYVRVYLCLSSFCVISFEKLFFSGIQLIFHLI